MGLGKNILAGLAGGLAGGLVLSLFELGGMKTGYYRTPLIVNIERRIEDRLNISERSSYKQKVARAEMLHFGNTIFFGGIYGALRSILQAPAPVFGPLFGAGVFGVVLGGLMPALGLSRVPWKLDRPVALREFALHVLYGATVAGVFELLTRRGEDTREE